VANCTLVQQGSLTDTNYAPKGHPALSLDKVLLDHGGVLMFSNYSWIEKLASRQMYV